MTSDHGAAHFEKGLGRPVDVHDASVARDGQDRIGQPAQHHGGVGGEAEILGQFRRGTFKLGPLIAPGHAACSVGPKVDCS